MTFDFKVSFKVSFKVNFKGEKEEKVSKISCDEYNVVCARRIILLETPKLYNRHNPMQNSTIQ